MHNARTIVGGNVVAGNDAECALARIDPRNELFVFFAHQVGAFATPYDVGLFAQLFGVCRQARFGQNVSGSSFGVRIFAFHGHIVDFRTDAQGRIRRQCPRCCSPRKAVGIGAEAVAFQFELCRAGGIFHIAVTAGLVQFVRTQACAGSRRIGLNGIAFVEQPLVVEFFEQIPQRFDVFIVVGNVRVFQIDPITHFFGERCPLFGVFHHFATAGGVVVVHADFFADILFGDAEHFFHAEFHRQSVRIPSGFAAHLKALHRFVATKSIFDGACHHMVNAGHAVGRRRSLEKDECRRTCALVDTFVKQILVLPSLQHLFVDGRQVKMGVFLKLFHRKTKLFLHNN